MELKNTEHSQILKFKELLADKQQKIVIVSHRNPDGDAIGSSFALYNYFIKAGHLVDVIIPNNYPQFLNWVPNVKNTLVYEWHAEKCNHLLKSCDILIAVDFNDLSRIREFESQIEPDNCYKVLLDHHPDPGSFADLVISDTSVSSASELVYLFLKEIDSVNLMDKEIAECIYCGIMTDTGCFSFNSSKRQTFEIVGELLDFGINKDYIFSQVYNNYSADRMKLMGHCLHEKMTYIPEMNTAFIALSQEDIKNYNFKVGDSEGFVNIPLSIRGVKMSGLFTEKSDIVKISLRSKGNFAVNEIVNKYFAGGGHKNAAGGESKLSLDDTIAKFISILDEYKDQLSDDDSQ
ncbi:MAG: bifunctional oligoribonuclease/PAP phosphatase NrnA [Bacteroidales bacterium]|nr:bifunctional oligoribonuclease/PAP phosphatase NrnA [Bacteroidales bacterium]MBN2819281.1 bifunctional oligoribonuclease/PAP phosphatase NrnA [Bacteroidales bacterium]